MRASTMLLNTLITTMFGSTAIVTMALAPSGDSTATPSAASEFAAHDAATMTTASDKTDGSNSASLGQRAGRLPRIRGYVGSDATLTINKRTVTRGRYRLVVIDEATSHNWHIDGRRVDKETSVNGTGKWVWPIRLRQGTYRIVCDPHASSMKTSLEVTAD